MPRVSEPVLAANLRSHLRADRVPHNLGEFAHGIAASAAHVEHLADCVGVLHQQQVGRHHILDVDEISQLPAVLVDPGPAAHEVARAKESAHP